MAAALAAAFGLLPSAGVPDGKPPQAGVVSAPPEVGRARARESSQGAVVMSFRAPGDATLDVAGFDDRGPRDLVLWLRDPSRPHAGARQLARTRSTADGRFLVTGLLAPVHGGELVALPAGVDPRAGEGEGRDGAARRAAVAAAPAAGPLAWIDGPELVLALTRDAKRVQLAAADGRPFARLDAPAAQRRGATWRVRVGDLPRETRGGDAGPPVWIAWEANEAPPDWRPIRHVEPASHSLHFRDSEETP